MKFNGKHLMALLFAILLFSMGAHAETKDGLTITKYEWAFEHGQPCEITFQARNNYQRFDNRRYYFNRKGEMRALVENDYRLDGYCIWVFQSNHDVLGIKVVEKDSINDQLINNFNLKKKAYYLNDCVYSVYPITRDKKGNWLKARHSTKKQQTFVRSIAYYGEDVKAEARTQQILAIADSIESQCFATKESSLEKARSDYGVFWNFLVPVLFGWILTWAVCRFFRNRRKVSNLAIAIIIAILLYLIGNTIMLFGPFNDFFYYLFWFLTAFAAMIAYHLTLLGRCPHCASMHSHVVGRRDTYKTTTETAYYDDGTKKVLSRDVEHRITRRMHCEECGHEWNSTTFL